MPNEADRLEAVRRKNLESVVKAIGDFEYFRARGNFVDMIIRTFEESRDIEEAILELMDQLNPASIYYILRFGLRKEKPAFARLSETYDLEGQVASAFLRYFTTGEIVLEADGQDATDLVTCGLGYAQAEEKNVVIRELLVMECIRRMLKFSDIVNCFDGRVIHGLNPYMAQYLLEYFVATALVANYGPPEVDKNSIYATRSWDTVYIRSSEPNEVLFPNAICGPDIIYRSKHTQTIYIVLVKFIKNFNRRDALLACETTYPMYFYCKKRSMNVKPEVLGKSDAVRNDLLDMIESIQKDENRTASND